MIMTARASISGVVALLMLLFRMSHPVKLGHCEYIFGYDSTEICK